MDAEANQHGTETPDALPSSHVKEEKSVLDQATSKLTSTAMGAAKAATDVLDRSGITAVADDSGIEDGTRAATQAYNTEEMAIGGDERPS